MRGSTLSLRTVMFLALALALVLVAMPVGQAQQPAPGTTDQLGALRWRYIGPVGTHEDEYETLSGFVMMSLGRVPQVTDHFEWNSYKFEIMDMDGRRVDKLLVTTLPQKPLTQEPRGKQ